MYFHNALTTPGLDNYKKKEGVPVNPSRHVPWFCLTAFSPVRLLKVSLSSQDFVNGFFWRVAASMFRFLAGFFFFAAVLEVFFFLLDWAPPLSSSESIVAEVRFLFVRGTLGGEELLGRVSCSMEECFSGGEGSSLMGGSLTRSKHCIIRAFSSFL